MPTYNSANYLERTLKSLTQMIGADKAVVEVLFVDDGSTDQTLTLLEKTVATDPTTYRLLKARHGGVSKARNLGIKNATGEYVTFIDSDDAYTKNFIPTFLKQVESYPDLLWEDVHQLKDSGLHQIRTLNERLKCMSMVLGITKPFIQEGIASKFYRREFLLANKLMFNDKIVVSEDTLFILEAIDKAQSIYLSDLKFYQILEEHSLSRFNEKVLASELEYEQRVGKLLAKYPNDHVKRLLLARIKINGLCTLVRRYYGAKVIRSEMSVFKATSELKQLIAKDRYSLACWRIKALNLPLRYSILTILLDMKLYYMTLCFDVIVDKIKRVTWK